jgi:hypothetical protein
VISQSAITTDERGPHRRPNRLSRQSARVWPLRTTRDVTDGVLPRPAVVRKYFGRFKMTPALLVTVRSLERMTTLINGALE